MEDILLPSFWKHNTSEIFLFIFLKESNKPGKWIAYLKNVFKEAMSQKLVKVDVKKILNLLATLVY